MLAMTSAREARKDRDTVHVIWLTVNEEDLPEETFEELLVRLALNNGVSLEDNALVLILSASPFGDYPIMRAHRGLAGEPVYLVAYDTLHDLYLSQVAPEDEVVVNITTVTERFEDYFHKNTFELDDAQREEVVTLVRSFFSNGLRGN